MIRTTCSTRTAARLILHRRDELTRERTMCGRLNLRTNPAEVAEFFGLARCPDLTPRYNIAPTQRMLIVRAGQGGRVADFVHWGLIPSWSKDATGAARTINARAETVREKPSFRSAFKARRCLVPASGYYEWTPIAGQKTKQTWHIEPTTEPLLALAGLWETWQSPDGPLESCTIITTTPNAVMGEIHDRMPVVLGEDDWSTWIDPLNASPDRLQELLVPCPDEWIRKTPIGNYVNNARLEGPECLQPAR